MKMRFLWWKLYFPIIVTVLVIALLPCFANAASLKKIVGGVWINHEKATVYEFLSDGTVIIIVGTNPSIVGNYKIIDDDRIRVDLGGVANLFEASIDEKNILTLKEPTGDKSSFTFMSTKAYKAFKVAVYNATAKSAFLNACVAIEGYLFGHKVLPNNITATDFRLQDTEVEVKYTKNTQNNTATMSTTHSKGDKIYTDTFNKPCSSSTIKESSK